MSSSKKRFYWATVCVFFFNMFIMCFTLLAGFSAWTALESDARSLHVVASVIDMPNTAFDVHMVTEFFMVRCSAAWVHFYNVGVNLLRLAGFAAPFIDCLAVFYYEKDHFLRKEAYVLLTMSLIYFPISIDFVSMIFNCNKLISTVFWSHRCKSCKQFNRTSERVPCHYRIMRDIEHLR